MANTRETLSEYLGDIDAELLLQNLTNTNVNVNSIDELRDGFRAARKRGEVLTVEAEFSYEVIDEGNNVDPKSKRFERLTIELDTTVTMEEMLKRIQK
jgi:hypothetical protein